MSTALMVGHVVEGYVVGGMCAGGVGVEAHVLLGHCALHFEHLTRIHRHHCCLLPTRHIVRRQSLTALHQITCILRTLHAVLTSHLLVTLPLLVQCLLLLLWRLLSMSERAYRLCFRILLLLVKLLFY